MVVLELIVNHPTDVNRLLHLGSADSVAYPDGALRQGSVQQQASVEHREEVNTHYSTAHHPSFLSFYVRIDVDANALNRAQVDL